MFRRIDSIFCIKERGSTIQREITGGATTFVTLAYIVFVQPVILSAAGMDFGAVMNATCIGSAIACFIMGLAANHPIALAPAMGHNFYFVFTVVLAMGISWQTALAGVFVAGILFFIISVIGMRKKIIDSLPPSLMNAITCGIGLLIAMIGLEWSGIIVDKKGTLVGLGDLSALPVVLALLGLAIMSILIAKKIPGAIIIGIFVTAIAGIFFGVVEYQGTISIPPSISPTLFKLDFKGIFSSDMIVVVTILLFLDVFDTIGTLVGIAPEAGMMKNGKPVITNQAFLADASATVLGSLLGTSTITCYIESAAGIQSGARSGLAPVVTGILLLLTPFFYPLVKMVGGGVPAADGALLYPVTAPALIIVGVMMMKSSAKIAWTDPSEAIPAFLTIIMMPLTISITEGIAFGLISYSILAIACGNARKTPLPLHLCAALLLLRYIFLV